MLKDPTLSNEERDFLEDRAFQAAQDLEEINQLLESQEETMREAKEIDDDERHRLRILETQNQAASNADMALTLMGVGAFLAVILILMLL